MSNPLFVHQQNVTEKLLEVNVHVTETKDLPYGVQLFLSDNRANCKINLYNSKKKGNSIVQAGGDKNLLSLVLSHLSLVAKADLDIPSGFRIGSDEAGKGDYFGPLVVAAVGCKRKTAAALLQMGVGDSKKLSNTKVKELYEKITVMDDIEYSVCSLLPLKYNAMFEEFKHTGRNSLDILAFAHGEVLNGLSNKTEDSFQVVVDKFCNMNRLSPWLEIPVSQVELRVRAEDTEPVVAAASIIARSVYLAELSRFSLKYNFVFTPGSGASVDTLGRRLVRRFGSHVLTEIAKEHFVNSKRISANP